jgi:lactoylglutathione lyase
MAVKTDVKLTHASYVILYVPETEKALTFYRDTLGMTVKTSEDGWVELDAGPITLALHHADKIPQRSTDAAPTVVFTVEKIQEAYEALKEKGVKFHKEPQQVCQTPDHIGMCADFADPWGNAMSIFAMEPRK